MEILPYIPEMKDFMDREEHCRSPGSVGSKSKKSLYIGAGRQQLDILQEALRNVLIWNLHLYPYNMYRIDI